MRLFPSFDPRLSADLKSQKRTIVVGLVCTAVTSTLYASTIWLTKTATGAINDIWDSRGDADAQQVAMDSLTRACLAFVLIFGLRYFFTRGQVYYLSQAANRLAADLRVRMFRKLMRLPVSYFNERRAGAIQSVLTNDVNVYQNAVGIIRDSIDGPIKAIAAFVTLLIIQWQLALVGILLVPVMVLVIQRNSRRMKAAQRQVQADLAEVGATTQESLQGTRVVKAFGAEERIGGLYADLVDRSYESQMRSVTITAALRPLVELIGAFALAILLYIGGRIAMSGQLDSSHIVAMAFAMDTINQGFRSLAGVSNTYAGVQAASERIYREVLDFPEDYETGGGKTLAAPEGRIEFRHVTFAYPDGTMALRDVSFVLEPGQALALVGPSGAGKSTIADLVLRFYDPTEGGVFFDGIDVRELDVNWLRSQIGVVPQHTFLFAGSIRENICLGNPDATDDDVAESLRLAHAEEFVREMESRDTPVLGERGVRLSGGQMQRVAIARALIRKPTILLLDEATSALDATSEKAVTEALDEVMHQRTTLFIAHRLTTAARADRILVLSKGEVVETGSHTELMAANGAYAGLFRAFSGGVLE